MQLETCLCKYMSKDREGGTLLAGWWGYVPLCSGVTGWHERLRLWALHKEDCEDLLSEASGQLMPPGRWELGWDASSRVSPFQAALDR